MSVAAVLAEFCAASAPSGAEGDLAELLLGRWRGRCRQVRRDAVGNVTLVFSAAAHDGDLRALKHTGLPQYRSWLYALDAVLPIVSFGQEAAWSPTGWSQYWYGFCVLGGWALITVLVGALTRRLVRD